MSDWRRAPIIGVSEHLAGDAVERLARCRGTGVSLAILDSGIDRSHPVLHDAAIGGDLGVSADGGVEVLAEEHSRDAFGHGTAVAGLVYMLAPGAQLCSFRVLDGKNRAHARAINAAAMYAMELGCDILHCSFGSPMLQRLWEYKRWVDAACRSRVQVVAASSNLSVSVEEYPSYFTSVIGVSAVPHEGETRLASIPDALIDLAVPGEDICCPWEGGGYRSMSGSSFAAPIVTALVARVLEAWPNLEYWEVKALLLRLGDIGVPLGSIFGEAAVAGIFGAQAGV